MNKETFELRSGIFPLSFFKPSSIAISKNLMTKNLKAIISKQKRKLTHQDIANKLGISRPYVTHLLSGERENPDLLARIYDILKKEGLI
ncbi:helix-turn-helix domain-containing protein [Candidatus Nomurabacteria bacterium]|nr:helix-turn-helix domain-containing protein [Candidatus Nomurabacteria bacterium]